MTRILRNASLVCLLALAAASQAITLTDDFSDAQAGVTLTQTDSATSGGTSLGGGLTRFLINTQTQNGFPGIDSSGVSISGGSFNFDNGPTVTSGFAIDYRYSSAVDFTGLTGFRVDYRTNDQPYDLFVSLRDSAGRESLFSSRVGGGASFSVFANALTNEANLADIVLVSFQSNGTQAGTDSSIVGIQSVQATSAVPGPMAALPFALMALKRRKRA